MEKQIVMEYRIMQPTIRLKRGMKGDYGWDIQVYGNSDDSNYIKKLIKEVKKIDEQLKEENILKEGTKVEVKDK